jgi:predicted nucleic acid-binding protein
MLVVDASYAVRACGVADGFALLRDDDLVAPPLMWSETRSALHEAAWRGEIDAADAASAQARLDGAPVASRSPRRLGKESLRIADELGWAKTYDAEYLALARLLTCRVVTLDSRLRRGGGPLGLVVLPTEL